MTSIKAPPAAPRGFLRQKRRSVVHHPVRGRPGAATVTSSSPASATARSVAIPDPGIEPAVQHDDEEVREDDDDGDEHQEGLHERIGRPEDRPYKEAAVAREAA